MKPVSLLVRFKLGCLFKTISRIWMWCPVWLLTLSVLMIHIVFTLAGGPALVGLGLTLLGLALLLPPRGKGPPPLPRGPPRPPPRAPRLAEPLPAWWLFCCPPWACTGAAACCGQWRSTSRCHLTRAYKLTFSYMLSMRVLSFWFRNFEFSSCLRSIMCWNLSLINSGSSFQVVLFGKPNMTFLGVWLGFSYVAAGRVGT